LTASTEKSPLKRKKREKKKNRLDFFRIKINLDIIKQLNLILKN